MESIKKQNDAIRKVYTKIARLLITPTFNYPDDERVSRAMETFRGLMVSTFGDRYSSDRVADYVIFQMHKNRNSIYHEQLAYTSFLKTAFSKYLRMSSSKKMYFEDNWLKSVGLDRGQIRKMMRTKGSRTLSKFNNPEYEERTKRRHLNSPSGFASCLVSTTLWSPKSESCAQCKFSETCKKTLQRKIPELYKLRTQEYEQQQQEVHSYARVYQ